MLVSEALTGSILATTARVLNLAVLLRLLLVRPVKRRRAYQFSGLPLHLLDSQPDSQEVKRSNTGSTTFARSSASTAWVGTQRQHRCFSSAPVHVCMLVGSHASDYYLTTPA